MVITFQRGIRLDRIPIFVYLFSLPFDCHECTKYFSNSFFLSAQVFVHHDWKFAPPPVRAGDRISQVFKTANWILASCEQWRDGVYFESSGVRKGKGFDYLFIVDIV